MLNSSIVETQAKWHAVGMLTLAAFAIVTSEFLPIGLLGDIAASLHVTEGLAGLMVTMPGLLAACSGPLLMALVARQDRRTVLATLCLLLLASDLLAALAPGIATMLAARVVLGVVVGGFWTFAPGAAAQLVPANQQPRAMAWILAGISAATIAGVPLGVYIGNQLGWRGAFSILAALALLLATTLWRGLPSIPATAPQGTGAQHESGLLAPLRSGPALWMLVITLTAIAAHFATYTYLTPLLQHQFGLSQSAVMPLLLAYGAAGLAGTLIAPRLIARNLYGTLLSAFLMTAVALSFALYGGGLPSAIVCILVWGCGFGLIPGGLSAWMLQAQPHATDAGQAWFVGFFQTAIAIGAWAGGLLLDHGGTTHVALMGMSVELVAAALLLIASRSQKAVPGKAGISSDHSHL